MAISEATSNRLNKILGIDPEIEKKKKEQEERQAAIKKQLEEKEKRKTINEFDRLKMYFREPFFLEVDSHKEDAKKKFEILQPSVGDIVHFGESDFYTMLNIFISNPTSLRLQLWKQGIDWNKITEFELFLMMYKGASLDSTYLLFGDLDFTTFEPKQFVISAKRNEETGEPVYETKWVLHSEAYDMIIDETSHLIMVEYLRTMFGIFPKVEKAKGKATKESIIWEDERELNKQKKKPKTSTSMLLPLVSSCVNHPGFKYRPDELKQIGIYEFMDSVHRLQIYENTVALLRGMYSGMIDSKGIDKDNLNFMREEV